MSLSKVQVLSQVFCMQSRPSTVLLHAGSKERQMSSPGRAVTPGESYQRPRQRDWIHEWTASYIVCISYVYLHVHKVNDVYTYAILMYPEIVLAMFTHACNWRLSAHVHSAQYSSCPAIH